MLPGHFHLEPMELARASCSLVAPNVSADCPFVVDRCGRAKAVPLHSGTVPNDLADLGFHSYHFYFQTPASRIGAGPIAELSPGLALQQRLAEGLKQGPINGIALRIVLGMPLHAECEARRVGDPDRLDRAVLCHTLDD